MTVCFEWWCKWVFSFCVAGEMLLSIKHTLPCRAVNLTIERLLVRLMPVLCTECEEDQNV